jgi:hypothetical protein
LAPAAGDERLDADTFLLAGGCASPVTCGAAALVWSVGRGGMKRARVAAKVFPTSVPPLGFGAFGDAPTTAAASVVSGIE